ncbi:MAG: universal stress protein [Thaumarchaeota archaeon]|nr:MAG: universal stress protein [Nitrososphaerota archaeon]TLX90113.1 MAG: universal stress protein [Nitrososphaerota archaeon]
MSQDLKISKILVAVDGSDNSMRAVDYAIKLGLRFDADLIALHVAPGGKYDSEEYLKYTKREYSYVDKIGQKSVTAAVKLEIDVITAKSSVVNEIIEYADKKNIDLIVIGIRSVSEFRFMLGSTASGVVINASCPVLVVK